MILGQFTDIRSKHGYPMLKGFEIFTIHEEKES